MTTTTITNCHFTVTDFTETKQKVLNWLKRFDTFSFLDNHQYQTAPHTVECLAAAGVRNALSAEDMGHDLERLRAFATGKKSWFFGHLGYDLKNEVEQLSSGLPDRVGFPTLYFFEPEVVIRFSETRLEITATDPRHVWSEINALVPDTGMHTQHAIRPTGRFTREEYLEVIHKLRGHIRRGDCYEINFCQEFFAENTPVDPVSVYQNLSAISPNPFSALYRVRDQWLLCASPERFLRKEGNRVISQPIKGTASRVFTSEQQDEQKRVLLGESEKDRSENVMVVDLVRNDLSRVCREGTVQVDELFGVYTFPQVHQMISTISGELLPGTDISTIIRATFPMGSMTGAPKKRVMELIETYERTRRGLFSGAVGYIDPEGNFDFNVVIRSVLYNASTQYLSFQVGSGITYYSEPEKEWEECLLKAQAIQWVLEKNRY